MPQRAGWIRSGCLVPSDVDISCIQGLDGAGSGWADTAPGQPTESPRCFYGGAASLSSQQNLLRPRCFALVLWCSLVLGRGRHGSYGCESLEEPVQAVGGRAVSHSVLHSHSFADEKTGFEKLGSCRIGTWAHTSSLTRGVCAPSVAWRGHMEGQVMQTGEDTSLSYGPWPGTLLPCMWLSEDT